MPMTLQSPAFEPGSRIPDLYTCQGDDISPPIAWSGVPAEARSLVLLCDDPDAPAGTWHHWALYDLSPTTSVLPERYPTAATLGTARQATNDFRRSGYGGPCPPPGHGVHHYHFKLLALRIDKLPLRAAARCADVAAAAQPHAVASAELIGTYSR